jgi:hypothetical protein
VQPFRTTSFEVERLHHLLQELLIEPTVFGNSFRRFAYCGHNHLPFTPVQRRIPPIPTTPNPLSRLVYSHVLFYLRWRFCFDPLQPPATYYFRRGHREPGNASNNFRFSLLFFLTFCWFS